MKSDKMLYMIHSDIEPLIEKTDNSNNDLEKSSTTKKKKGKNILCGYSMSTIWAFHHLENSLFHRQGCMKKFSESLREHAKNIIQIEKKNMLAKKKRTKITSRCNRMLHLPKNSCKKDHCHFLHKYTGTAHDICNLRFNFPTKFL